MLNATILDVRSKCLQTLFSLHFTISTVPNALYIVVWQTEVFFSVFFFLFSKACGIKDISDHGTVLFEQCIFCSEGTILFAQCNFLLDSI